jgi:hypothetical protein
MTAYMNRYLGPHDLQIGAWDESLRCGGYFNQRLFRDLLSRKALISLARSSGTWLCDSSVGLTTIVNWAQKSVYEERLSSEPAHATALEVRQGFAKEWDGFFKFCFVRNPYERAVSDYRWRTRNVTGVSFLEFLRRMENPERPDPERVVPVPASNWSIYTIDDRLAVDFAGRYERLIADFASVCERVAISFQAERFPTARQSGLSDYRDYYGAEEGRLVRSLFGNEIEFFGYRL